VSNEKKVALFFGPPCCFELLCNARAVSECRAFVLFAVLNILKHLCQFDKTLKKYFKSSLVLLFCMIVVLDFVTTFFPRICSKQTELSMSNTIFFPCVCSKQTELSMSDWFHCGLPYHTTLYGRFSGI